MTEKAKDRKMTDEEMADKYVRSQGNANILNLGENTVDLSLLKRGVFLDGLKAGRPKWHDLRKDPNDLPEPNIAVLICFQFEKWTTTYIAYYRPTIKKWQMYNMHEAQRQPVVDDYIDRDEAIAWCEIPKYTGE